jgi:hypothetical protein
MVGQVAFSAQQDSEATIAKAGPQNGQFLQTRGDAR